MEALTQSSKLQALLHELNEGRDCELFTINIKEEIETSVLISDNRMSFLYALPKDTEYTNIKGIHLFVYNSQNESIQLLDPRLKFLGCIMDIRKKLMESDHDKEEKLFNNLNFDVILMKEDKVVTKLNFRESSTVPKKYKGFKDFIIENLSK